MAKAFQCDRCGKLVAGETNKLVGQYTYKNKELCDECFEEYEMFMDGAELGMCNDDVGYVFNVLNEVHADVIMAKQEPIHMDCCECYHRYICDSYAGEMVSDASQCKLFAYEKGINKTVYQNAKLMNVVEKCLTFLDSYSSAANRKCSTRGYYG